MARMRADALATLLERSDSHHCLSPMAAPRSLKFRVAIQVQPGITSVLSSAMSRPKEANPVTRKELWRWRRLVKTASSERQRLCRHRLEKTSGSGCELGRGCFVFEMFDFRGKSPEEVGPALCTQHSKREKKKSEIRTAVKLELINACTPHPGAMSLGLTEGRAHSPPNPCPAPPSHPPPPPPSQRATRDRAWHRVARVAPRFRHRHPRLRRHIDGSLLACSWGFSVRHSLEDLHAQLGCVTRTIAT